MKGVKNTTEFKSPYGLVNSIEYTIDLNKGCDVFFTESLRQFEKFAQETLIDRGLVPDMSIYQDYPSVSIEYISMELYVKANYLRVKGKTSPKGLSIDTMDPKLAFFLGGDLQQMVNDIRVLATEEFTVKGFGVKKGRKNATDARQKKSREAKALARKHSLLIWVKSPTDTKSEHFKKIKKILNDNDLFVVKDATVKRWIKDLTPEDKRLQWK